MSRRHTNDESYGRSNNQPLHQPSRRHSTENIGYNHHNNIDYNAYDNNHHRGPLPLGNNDSNNIYRHRQQSQPRTERRSNKELLHDDVGNFNNRSNNNPNSRSSSQRQPESKYHNNNNNNANSYDNYLPSQQQSRQQQQPSGILKGGNKFNEKNYNLKVRVDKLKKTALDNAKHGLWLESHNLLLEALALQKDLQHDYLEKAHTCHHLGLALNRLRKYDSALDALYDSLQLRKKYGGDQLDIAATVHTIGVVKGFSGDYVGAIKNLRMAATIQKSILGRPDETTL